MELMNLISRMQQEAGRAVRTTAPAPAPSADDASKTGPPPPKSEKNSSGDRVEIRSDAAKPEASVDEKVARKLAEKAEERDQKTYSDILKIVSENAPHVMKSIRAIIAQRAGVDQNKPAPDPNLLGETLKIAAGSPDPSRRVADVVQGVGLVPPDQKDDFLKAAQALMGMENAAAGQALRPLGPPPFPPPPDAAIAVDPMTGNYAPENVGFSVEVNFDLFFSVSARSSMTSYEGPDGSFYEATQEVAAAFESGFSIKVAGRFLTLADLATEIDPEVLDSFSKATAGLAGLDEESLNRFFDATEDLFNELEESLGLSSDALDGIEAQVKGTAQSFFEAVGEVTEGTFPGLKLDQIFELPEGMDSNGTTDLLTLLGEVAEKRRPDSSAQKLMEALSAAENGRALGAAPEDLSPLEELLKGAYPLAA